jgi:hypothetical protein
MASGDTLTVLTPQNHVPTTTVAATLDTFNSADTVVQTYLVLDFDSAQTEYADFAFVVPANYTASANLDVYIGWTCDTAGGTDGVVWSVQFKSVTDDADDLDTVTFGTAQDFAESTPASVAGEMQVASKTGITFAAAGSPLAGEILFVRLYRDHDAADDTLANDAEFHFMEIREA